MGYKNIITNTINRRVLTQFVFLQNWQNLGKITLRVTKDSGASCRPIESPSQKPLECVCFGEGGWVGFERGCWEVCPSGKWGLLI